ncbi:hypothetical protein [Saliterribacillus persicus]|nr:hypothetical protein [Saliterribacillus persicus]
MYEIATHPSEQRQRKHITANGEEKKQDEMMIKETGEFNPGKY